MESDSLVLRIAGRKALPVRALPFVLGTVFAADEVARGLAKRQAPPFVLFDKTVAFHLVDGSPQEIPAREWDLVAEKLAVLERNLRKKYPPMEGEPYADSEGYIQWREQSPRLLHAGAFVWLDDLLMDYRERCAQDRLNVYTDRPGERTLMLSPLLSSEQKEMIFERFASISNQVNKTALPLPATSLAWPTDRPVTFGELAHVIANALWPDDSHSMRYGAARVNLDAELAEAVTSGSLTVRDPLTMGKHPFPIGDSLNDAVVLLEDIRPFLSARGVAVVVGKPESDADATARSADPAASAVKQSGSVVHSTKPARRNILTPIIERAQSECRNPHDASEVWAQLTVLAEKKQPPLIGVTEEGLQYLAVGTAKFLSRDALAKRLHRQAT